MLDVLLHTLVGAVILGLVMVSGGDWELGTGVAGMVLLAREIGQAQMVCMRGYSHELRSHISNGWHARSGGIFSVRRTVEWAVPTAILYLVGAFI